MSSGRVVLERDTISPRLDVMAPKFEAAMGALAQYSANDIQNYMRTNAPWSDRTSNARQGLFAQAFTEKLSWVIVLAHSVPYGIWLEVRWDGRYAIINPTLLRKGPEVMRRVEMVLRELM